MVFQEEERRKCLFVPIAPGIRGISSPPVCGGRDGTFLLRLLKEGPEGKTLYPALGDPARPAPGPETVRRRVRWLLPVLSAEIHLLG